MVLSRPVPSERARPQRRYVRPPAPLHFPSEERVPESEWHFWCRVALAESVKQAFGDQALVVCDMFTYWDPTDPTKRLSPDVAVRLGQRPSELLKSWPTWLLGAPQVGVEIVSDSDTSNLTLEEKLERYRRAGIAEVVRFDPADGTLRLWDLIDGDLVERDLGDASALRCDALGLYWIVKPAEKGHPIRTARRRPRASALSSAPAGDPRCSHTR